jgi:polyisoprenoid-binding protein YceI
MNTDGQNGSPAPTSIEALVADSMVGHWSLDPAGSSVQFHEKHFWGLITVHGTFEEVSGEATVARDGTITARLSILASSLSTKNAARDRHLRSAEFFDAERRPTVEVNVTQAEPDGRTLRCRGSLDAAGHSEPIEFTATAEESTPTAVVLRAELTVDRRAFSMTWSPLGIASRTSRGTVVARFVRD